MHHLLTGSNYVAVANSERQILFCFALMRHYLILVRYGCQDEPPVSDKLEIQGWKN